MVRGMLSAALKGSSVSFTKGKRSLWMLCVRNAGWPAGWWQWVLCVRKAETKISSALTTKYIAICLLEIGWNRSLGRSVLLEAASRTRCSVRVRRSTETLGGDRVDGVWEMLSRNGFSSEPATSNSWSLFTPECGEYADQVGKVWDQRAFFSGGK